MDKISYDDKLRKGQMSTKLTRPHSTHSTTMCGVWCFKHFTNFSHSQRPSQRLSQTSERAVSADGGHLAYDVNWVVALNMAQLSQSCR